VVAMHQWSPPYFSLPQKHQLHLPKEMVMPQKVLHCLFTADEEREMRANGFGLDTHGIHHVVIQFERGKRKVQIDAQPVAAIEAQPQPHSHLHRQIRRKTASCRYCKKPCAPQGKWKHEKFCVKRPKGGK